MKKLKMAGKNMSKSKPAKKSKKLTFKTLRFVKFKFQIERNLWERISLFVFLSIYLISNFLAYFPSSFISLNLNKNNSQITANGKQVAPGVWENPPSEASLSKFKPISQVIAKDKTNLNVKEGSTTSLQNDTFRWSVTLSNGTKFMFGKETKAGILPVVNIENTSGYYINYVPNVLSGYKYVSPKVKDNVISWQIEKGITARYTMKSNEVKADYIVDKKEDFLTQRVDFNVSYGGKTSEDSKKLYLEQLAGGDLTLFSANNYPVFRIPAPIAFDKNQRKVDSKYSYDKSSKTLSILVNLTGSETYPLTIDPVTIDSSAWQTCCSTNKGMVKDAWGNIITAYEGQGNDLQYKNYDSDTWVDPSIDISGQDTAIDIDAKGNVYAAYNKYTTHVFTVTKFTVTRDSSNHITGVSKGTEMGFEVLNLRGDSLVIANKGEGAGVEKVVVAWGSNSTSGTIRGTARVMMIDTEVDYTVAANWTNVSKEINGTGGTAGCSDIATSGSAGLPSSPTCHGTSDQLFTYTSSNTTHIPVVFQMPAVPKRTPFDVEMYTATNSAYRALGKSLDNNASTTEDVSSLSSGSYIYIGDTKQFSKIIIDSTDTNSSASDLVNTAQYWNGSTWTSLSNVADYTKLKISLNIISLGQDGSIMFNEPSDWSTTSVNGGSSKYWVRFSPNLNFDSSVSIAEVYVTDRNSQALVVVGGVDATDDLRAAYIPWDEINNNRWQKNGTVLGNGWTQDAGGASSALSDTGGNWGTFTNWPLSYTIDYKNNRGFVGYVNDLATDAITLESIPENKDVTVAANWTDSSYPVGETLTSPTLSLDSDGSNIYIFYGTNLGVSTLNYRKCTPSGGGDPNICDNSSDWGSAHSFANVAYPPFETVTKVSSDTIAFDLVFGSGSVLWERVYPPSNDNSITVAASADDTWERDCDSGGDDEQVTADVIVGRVGSGDGGCDVSTIPAKHYGGFRFAGVNVAQGAKISSAYIDFNIDQHAGSTAVPFTVYGVDSSNAVDGSGGGWPVYTNCTSSCTNMAGTATRTTSSYSYSVNFNTVNYRIDITNLVQEIACRGATAAQPCVGNFDKHTASSWVSGNAMGIVFIATDTGSSNNYISITSQDNTWTYIKPTIQINVADNSSAANKINDSGNPGAIYGTGRQVVRTSAGTLYSFIYSGGTCGIWKSSDGATWTEQDSAHHPACNTSGSAIAIDSSGIIHAAFGDSATQSSEYITFNTSTDQFGSEEVIRANPPTSGASEYSIAVDSNNKPHVVFHVGSAGGDPIFYFNKVTGSWNSPADLTSIGCGTNCEGPDITIDKDNFPEISMIDFVAQDLYVLVGNQNNPSSFTAQDVDTSVNTTSGTYGGSIAVDPSGNTWVAYVDSTGTNQINLVEHIYGNAWSTWQTAVTDSGLGAEPSIAINSGNVYIFYQGTNTNIVYDKYNPTSSTWSGAHSLSGSGFQNVHAKWSYLNDNSSASGIDYLYSDGTDIYYDRLTFSSLPTLSYSLSYSTKLATGSASVSNLEHLFSSTEYGAVISNDSSYAVASSGMQYASSSAVPAFMFKVNNSNNNNTYGIDASVIAKSSVPTNTNPVYLQVYRGGSTNDWVTMARDNSTAANTDFTITSPSIKTNLSEYYFNETPGIGTQYAACTNSTANCWSYWRIYQDAPIDSTNEILSVNQASITYVSLGPDHLAFSVTPGSFTAGDGTSPGGSCSGGFTLQTQDASNTAINPLSSTVVSLSSNSSGTVVFYSNSSCTGGSTITQVTFSGTHDQTFYVSDTRKSVTTWTLTASRTSGDSPLTDGTTTYTVTAGAVTKLLITLPGQTFTDGVGNSGTVTNQVAGTSFNIVQISAVDNNFNVNPTSTNYDNDTRTLVYSGPANSPSGSSPTYTTSVQFTNGISTTTLVTTLKKAIATTNTITVTDGGALGNASGSVVVVPGSVTGANSTVLASNSNINTDVSVTITLQDALQNPLISLAGSSISFAGTTGNYTITSSPTTTDSVTGVSTALIQWATPGSKTITVTVPDGTLSNNAIITISQGASNTSIGGGTIIRGGTKIN